LSLSKGLSGTFVTISPLFASKPGIAGMKSKNFVNS
jgi:hypothetical protein